MLWRSIIFTLAATLTSATNLFIADYGGDVTSVSLTEKVGNYSLDKTFTNRQCAPNPSWLTIDANRGLLFCLNEGLTTPNGSLSSFTINTDGSLTHVQNTTTPNGPVSGVIYGNPVGQRGIVLAHYVGSAVSSWLLNGQGHFEKNQEFFYTLSKPGTVPDRQDAPHEHEAILDPTGQYILVPDLGADLVRVFSWEQGSLKLKPLDPLQAKAGSGPRHAAFWNPYSVACDGCTTYMYLVAELGATVTSYAVSYLPNGGGLSFKEVDAYPTLGNYQNNRTNAPAEIHVTPDNKYITISNRNDSSFSLQTPDGSILESDSLSTFALNDDGTLVFHQLWPAGGSFPRQYSMNAPGTLVAVGLQNTNLTRVLARNPNSGLIGEPVADIPANGNVVCVVWDEEKALGVLGG